MATEESTDGLPPGWKTKVEVRNGRKIKIYLNMKSGVKCYSKPAVFRLLDTERPQSPTRHSKSSSRKNDEQDPNGSWNNKPVLEPAVTKRMEIHNGKKVVIETALDDDLPPGWIKEIRRKQMGGKIRRDSFYINPTGDYMFNSKVDALRYVETGQSRLARKRKNGSINEDSTGGKISALSSSCNEDTLFSDQTVMRHEEIHNGTKVVIETTVDKDLPSGWIKEIRIKNTRGKIRRDSFYINPVGDYIFNSKVDALRYVETGQLSRLAKKRKNVDISELSTRCNIPPPVSSKKATTGAARKCLFAEPGDLGNQQAQVLSAATRSATKAKGRLAFSSNDILVEGISVDSLIGKDSEDTSLISKRKSRSQKEHKEALMVPCRLSGQLAEVKAQPVVSSVPIEPTTRATRRTSQKTEPVLVLGSTPYEITLEKSEQVQTKSRKQPPRPAVRSSAQSGKTKSSSKRVGHRGNSIDKESPIVAEKDNQEPLSSGVKTIQEHPVADQPPGSTEAKGNEIEQSESPFCCTAIWADPCLEFAYKTLTGALPLDGLDDDQAIQDYVDHQLRTSSHSNGSLNASNVGMPSGPSDGVQAQVDLMKPASVEPIQTMLAAPPPPADGHLPNVSGSGPSK